MAASRPAPGWGTRKDRGNHGNHHLRRNCCRLGYHRRLAAKELTEKGLNTLVLEAGRSIVPERDYVEHVPVWNSSTADGTIAPSVRKRSPFSASATTLATNTLTSFS